MDAMRPDIKHAAIGCFSPVAACLPDWPACFRRAPDNRNGLPGLPETRRSPIRITPSVCAPILPQKADPGASPTPNRTQRLFRLDQFADAG